MSQNKTIVPGINYNDLDKEGAQDPFYDSLYSSTSSNEGHTIIGGGNVMNMQKSANQPISSVNLMSPIKNNGRTLIMKERVIVGVMFSISRGLLGEIFPVYLAQLSIPEKFSKKSPLSEVRRRHIPFFVSL